MTNQDRIENNFTYHKPTQEKAEKYPVIRGEAKDFAYTVDLECPDSREKSLAMTKIEEAVMWANAAISRS